MITSPLPSNILIEKDFNVRPLEASEFYKGKSLYVQNCWVVELTVVIDFLS